MILSVESRKELSWWIENVHRKNGKRIRPKSVDLICRTDSSLSGWGAYDMNSGNFTNGRWNREEIQHSINYLELLAIFMLFSRCMCHYLMCIFSFSLITLVLFHIFRILVEFIPWRWINWLVIFGSGVLIEIFLSQLLTFVVLRTLPQISSREIFQIRQNECSKDRFLTVYVNSFFFQMWIFFRHV